MARTHRVVVSLAGGEKKVAIVFAEEQGLSLSAYFRSLLYSEMNKKDQIRIMETSVGEIRKDTFGESNS